MFDYLSFLVEFFKIAAKRHKLTFHCFQMQRRTRQTGQMRAASTHEFQLFLAKLLRIMPVKLASTWTLKRKPCHKMKCLTWISMRPTDPRFLKPPSACSSGRQAARAGQGRRGGVWSQVILRFSELAHNVNILTTFDNICMKAPPHPCLGKTWIGSKAWFDSDTELLATCCTSFNIGEVDLSKGGTLDEKLWNGDEDCV